METPLLRGNTPAHSFRAVAVGRGRIAFLAEGPGAVETVMLWQDGQLLEVATTGDRLDGDRARTFGLGPQGLSGDSLVFHVELENGKQALYRASLATE